MANGDANGNGKYVSTKFLVAILIAIVFAAVGLIVADTRGGVSKAQDQIQCLQKDKLDRETYYRDMTEIRETLIRMDFKLDRIRAGK